MNWETVADYAALSQRAAEMLLAGIRRDPRLVLGLPTGRTPVGMYERVEAVARGEYLQRMTEKIEPVEDLARPGIELDQRDDVRRVTQDRAEARLPRVGSPRKASTTLSPPTQNAGA